MKLITNLSVNHSSKTAGVAALALTAALVGTSLQAAEAVEPIDNTPQHLGFGAGAVAGAVVGGPIGAILGGTFGAMIGQDEVKQRQLVQTEELARHTEQRLVEQQRQLQRVEQQLAEKQAQIEQAEQQLAGLGQQHEALQQWVSGLRLSVYFDHNSSSLKNKYQPMLQSISQGPQQVPGMRIDLEGHTDRAGLSDYNQQLANKRNQQVSEALVDSGTAAELIDQNALGSLNAQTDKIYAPEDRRVDLRFTFDPRDAVVSRQ
ncbi:OmpA family protein [Motiliproteus sp.]|uniref:OmpA family protein n=1 Tax=Motiliproteus sp. TaxID=1898955 RepID=UPI003BA8EA6D